MIEVLETLALVLLFCWAVVLAFVLLLLAAEMIDRVWARLRRRRYATQNR